MTGKETKGAGRTYRDRETTETEKVQWPPFKQELGMEVHVKESRCALKTPSAKGLDLRHFPPVGLEIDDHIPC